MASAFSARHSDSACFADSSGIVAWTLKGIKQGPNGPGMQVELDNVNYDCMGGVLVLLKVGSCVPTADGPVTFLKFGNSVDLMDPGKSTAGVNVNLLVPIGQMLLQQLAKELMESFISLPVLKELAFWQKLFIQLALQILGNRGSRPFFVLSTAP